MSPPRGRSGAPGSSRGAASGGRKRAPSGGPAPAAKRGAAARRGAPARAEGRIEGRAGGRSPAARGAAGRGAAAGPRRAPARGLGGEQVEGRQAVRELLLAGRRKVREVWVAADPEDAEASDDLAELAQSVRVPVRQVGRNRLLNEARTEAPQGVLAKAAPLPEAELDDLAVAARGKPAPFLVLSDGITDPGNLGALIRSAECAGATGIVLPRHRAAHITPTVAKAAAGAIEHVPMALVGGLPAAILRLKELGVRVVGLDMAGPRTLFDVTLGDEPVALVLGAEGAGLGRLVRQRCDEVVSIPQLGQLASLNVAAAGVLACYEVARRRLAARG
jgi:23S rRNA (guanosine2251-2'-O)-methyltransferase